MTGPYVAITKTCFINFEDYTVDEAGLAIADEPLVVTLNFNENQVIGKATNVAVHKGMLSADLVVYGPAALHADMMELSFHIHTTDYSRPAGPGSLHIKQGKLMGLALCPEPFAKLSSEVKS